MSDSAVDLVGFLGPKAFGVVSAVADPELRARVTAAIELSALALTVVDQLDLSPHELSDPETPNVKTWEALAPQVATVLVRVNEAGERLTALFPEVAEVAPGDEVSATDLERAFDLMASAESGGAEAAASFLRREQGLDLVVQTAASASVAQVGEGIRTLVNVLHQDIVMLGGKLRTPQIVGDRWFLLGELHQFLGQCAQCLEAIVATVFGALSDENLDDLLPRYTNATDRARKLRYAVTELAEQMNDLNEAIARATGEDLPLLAQALAETLADFSQRPTYKYLRPQDKRPIISFRVSLQSWQRQDPSGDRLRSELEGFTKFLALMCDLNWREQLAHHDARYLADAQEALVAGVDLALVVPSLMRVRGRSPALDSLLRNVARGLPPDRQELAGAVAEAISRLPPS